MNWTTPDDLKAQLARLWQRGQLLQPLVTAESFFPLALKLKSPQAVDLTERFEAVRTWIAALIAMPHVRIEWHDVRHRVQGVQRLPQSLWIDTQDDAFALLAKQRDANRFEQIVTETRHTVPALLPWLAKRPIRTLEHANQWSQLLAVVCWVIEHPHPGIYLRQVNIPGIHSKFIEKHRVILAELLDLTLPPHAIANQYTGAGQFAARYGFHEKPLRIQFRTLDTSISLLPGTILPQLTLDADNFARLSLNVSQVFITENEINFLSFPQVANAIVIFGGGYGWDALARAQWLSHCNIFYWGDIDTHGFAILDQLRIYFGNTTSLLMDQATLMAHQALWGEETEPITHDLPRLTPSEAALYDQLRDNRIRKNLRLEQEHIDFGLVETAVREIAGLI